MKCSYAAFGEQNKTDNDSKCQQVYKSLFLTLTSFSVISIGNFVMCLTERLPEKKVLENKEKKFFLTQTFARFKKKLYLCGLICVYTRNAVRVCKKQEMLKC